MTRLAIADRDKRGALAVGETWSAQGALDDDDGTVSLVIGNPGGEWGVDWDILYRPLDSFRGCRVRITVKLLEKP